MADLISRADALTEVKIIADGYWHHEVIRKAHKLLMQNIKAIPAVDAVEVVRCKDCKRYQKNTCIRRDWAYTKPNDFCSCCERKENEQSD